MTVINVFLTSDLGAPLDDFVQNGQRIAFSRLDTAAPRPVLDGAAWVFVDWVMDDCAGLELCRRLRTDQRTAEAHVTMVLERDDSDDRRRALRAGADDYIVGPLDRGRVLDRVLAVQGEGGSHRTLRPFERGPLVIDLAALQARWAGAPLALRPNEFRLLRFLGENPNRVLSRSDLIRGLGKQEPAIDARTVDVWIGRLRRALRQAGAGTPLRTVRSVGYVLDLV